MKLYLIRHGETDWNVQNKIQGKTDIHLNETGRLQAKGLAKKIKEGKYDITSIYTSGLKRAWETANIVGQAIGIEPVVFAGLEEMSLGIWEGYTWKQVKEEYPEEYQSWYKDRRYHVIPEGESYQQLLERLLPALVKILGIAEGNALIVTHSADIMTIMSYINDTPFEDMVKNYKTGNVGVVEIDREVLERHGF